MGLFVTWALDRAKLNLEIRVSFENSIDLSFLGFGEIDNLLPKNLVPCYAVLHATKLLVQLANQRPPFQLVMLRLDN